MSEAEKRIHEAIKFAGRTDDGHMIVEKEALVWALAEIDRLTRERNKARRTAEYWKAEHLAGNAEIERLRTTLRTCVWALRQPIDDWKELCERRALDEAARVLEGWSATTAACAVDAAIDAQIEQEQPK